MLFFKAISANFFVVGFEINPASHLATLHALFDLFVFLIQFYPLFI